MLTVESTSMPQQLPSAELPVWRRALAVLRPSHSHSAFTATVLLTAVALLSKIISLVRTKYIMHVLGRSAQADAYTAMFQLPDTIQYFLIGGATSITFVTMLTRYRESGREREGEEALSVIFTTMMLVLSVAVLLAEILAPLYVRVAFPGFLSDPAKFALCVHLTRIMLPGQVFFFGSGVFAAFLLARRQFTMQAFAPLIYNIGMIAGGVALYRYLGVSAIAWGGLAGVILGPFAVNGFEARRAGMRLKLHLDWGNRGLREWFGITLPLILGFSLVTVDSWIISHFASRIGGAVALLGYAKQIFSVPQALGQAAGAASLPFLATLYGRKTAAGEPDPSPFARSVNESVSRLAAVSLLLSSWMVAMAGPAVDLVFRGGLFHRADAGTMAVYFAIFSVSLCFWSAQAIYARAFYATANTVTPMIAATLVTLASLPIYELLFRLHGAVGLAVASDIGITVQAIVFAVLLHQRRMVPLGGLHWKELARSLAASAASAALLRGLMRFGGHPATRLGELVLLTGSLLLWIGTCYGVLQVTGSALPGQLMARFRR
jgi:putative peptidoglycan lipid II flippase